MHRHVEPVPNGDKWIPNCLLFSRRKINKTSGIPHYCIVLANIRSQHFHVLWLGNAGSYLCNASGGTGRQPANLWITNVCCSIFHFAGNCEHCQHQVYVGCQTSKQRLIGIPGMPDHASHALAPWSVHGIAPPDYWRTAICHGLHQRSIPDERLHN